MAPSDIDLLHDYVRNSSESSFRVLVERHIHMVHALAWRQTGDAHLADDVTQAVFIVLAEKAATIPPDTLIPGWLFRATRFAVANAQRAKVRREYWETKAAEMAPPHILPPEEERVLPLLNEALEQLPERDRTAILLRFFESKSHQEIGRSLGTSEDGAKMRLSRAVEKLRLIFRKRGVAIPLAALVGLLSAQGAHAAPASFVATAISVAFQKQTTVSTLPIVQETLMFMVQSKTKSLLGAAALFLVAVTASLVIPLFAAKAPAPATSTDGSPPVTLLFRDTPSWNRTPDFEEALEALNIPFHSKTSADMGATDLTRYQTIIIPGAQGRTEFYKNYRLHAAKFDRFVTNGGTLVLELNGAESASLPLPRGVTMVSHGAVENTILLPGHPVVEPLGGRKIRANFASHGYLINVPKEAQILVAETVEEKADAGRPTFAEYTHGAGRVLAACQCFHDRDGSGRGPVMETLLDYAVERQWFAHKAPTK
ncbi:MAG: sigma-70 family RNA polymerase sigma factor [Verrucomicrobiales bacterium]|nr:sigma-70 family RNA polymerase sigma factor [Verrucomicrobiales bacterium]